MSELEDLFRLLSADRKERQQQALLKSLGYLDVSDDAFGINKWTQILALERSEEEHRMQVFPHHEPRHLVSVLAIPNNFPDLSLDVGSQAFREWLSSLKWGYCPVVESPFRHSRPQASREGILLPAWLNRETQSVLERFLVIHRNGIAEFGLGAEVCYRQQDKAVFKLIHIVGRIWQFIGFYLELCSRFPVEQRNSITFWVNVRGTRNALLGDLAQGWKEPRPGYPEAYNPKCADKHLRFSKIIDAQNPENDIEALVRWFATRIDNGYFCISPQKGIFQRYPVEGLTSWVAHQFLHNRIYINRLNRFSKLIPAVKIDVLPGYGRNLFQLCGRRRIPLFSLILQHIGQDHRIVKDDAVGN